MSGLMPGLLFLAYLFFVIVLPIGTALGFLRRRGHAAGMCLAAACSSLGFGALFFALSILLVARFAPPGHDLMNGWALFGGVMGGFFVGAPLGTWLGAWGAAALICRRVR